MQHTSTVCTPWALYIATVGRTLRGLVVGMGVDGEQTEPFLHDRERYRANPPRRLHRRASPRSDPRLARLALAVIGARAAVTTAASAARDPARTAASAPARRRRCQRRRTTSSTPLPPTRAAAGRAHRAVHHGLGTGRSAHGRATGDGVDGHGSVARRRADRPQVHVQGRERLAGV